jgi:hypothetical protein
MYEGQSGPAWPFKITKQPHLNDDDERRNREFSISSYVLEYGWCVKTI